MDTTENQDPPVAQVAVVEPCPCCGYTPRTDTGVDTRVKFDYWRGLVYTQTRRVWIGPSEADVLKILLDAWPGLISRHDLETGLYGATYHDRERTGSRPPVVFVLARLRRKVKPLRLYVRNNPGRGWWLSREPAPRRG